MPRGDGTGPGGLGPMTGRAAGYCAGYSTPGFMNPYGGRLGLGRGYGRGYGFGYGRGYVPGYVNPIPYNPPVYGGGYYQPPIDPKQEIGILDEQAKALKGQLEAIDKRVSELKETKEK